MKYIATFAIAAAASVTTACSSSEPKPVSKETPAVSSPSPSAVAGPAERARNAALVAYTGMWADAADAAKTADWKDSALTHHATDRALGELVQILYDEQSRGFVSQGEPLPHAEVVQMLPDGSPTAVKIRDCNDTTAWIEVDAKTKVQPAGAVPGGHRLILARVALAEGIWRVTDLAINKIGSCS